MTKVVNMAERNTMQKEIIYSALCRMANHPTADEVYASVHEDHPSISRATVFRVLNKMADNGSIYKVHITNGADHFDHQTFRHYHAHCSRCGSVCDVNLAPLVMLDDKGIIADEDFSITGYSLQFNGVCAKCRESESA